MCTHTHTHSQTLTIVTTTLAACLQDLADKLLSAPVVTASPRFSRTKRSTSAFTLSHYAGPVSYSLDNFLDKNRDYEVEQHATLLAGAQQDLLAELFAASAAPAADSSTQQNGRTVSEPHGEQRSLCGDSRLLRTHTCVCSVPGGSRQCQPGAEFSVAVFFGAPPGLQQVAAGPIMEHPA